jgi:hypothetical protein
MLTRAFCFAHGAKIAKLYRLVYFIELIAKVARLNQGNLSTKKNRPRITVQRLFLNPTKV